jgi:hypothetical protein
MVYRAGSINRCQVEAGERLRAAMEASEPPMPGVTRSEVHAWHRSCVLPSVPPTEVYVAPWNRVAISGQQLEAREQVRRALAVRDNVLTPAVLWVLHDGTIRVWAAFAHVHHATVAELLRRGLGALADHYGLAMPRAV